MNLKTTITTLSLALIASSSLVPTTFAQAAASNSGDTGEMRTMEMNTTLPAKARGQGLMKETLKASNSAAKATKP